MVGTAVDPATPRAATPATHRPVSPASLHTSTDRARPMPESPLIGSLNSDALATFDEVLRMLGHADWDLSPCDITHVEAFWSANSFDVAAAGFILRLRGGRRTYLDVWIERALEEDAPPAKVEI